jgi:hypothetical protein
MVVPFESGGDCLHRCPLVARPARRVSAFRDGDHISAVHKRVSAIGVPRRPAEWCIAPGRDASQREQPESMRLALFDGNHNDLIKDDWNQNAGAARSLREGMPSPGNRDCRQPARRISRRLGPDLLPELPPHVATTVSRNACQNRGPKAPCGLLSHPRSLGGGPSSPLSVPDGCAGAPGCESLAFLLAIALPLARAAPSGRSDSRQ